MTPTIGEQCPLVGYEFEWMDLPEPVAAAQTRHQDCLDRDEHVPSIAASYYSLVEPYSFHLNIAGMGFCRAGMRRTAMTYQAEPQPFPEWPFASIEDWRAADQTRRDAYNEAERAASAQTIPGMVGIPEFKFLSNGPWIISANEIKEALDRYDAASSALRSELEADDLWCKWIEWLRETADRGGFTVH